MADRLIAEADARVGRVLNDKWTLEKLLGVGGMAAVYAGRHRNGARAAVKILHAALAKIPAVRERFLREGYAANRVEHRGAVQVLDDDIVKGGEDDGAAYLVMELLEGESLEERAAHAPPISEQELLAIADGVLEVLEAASAHGVVHRDLKPDNIFLARDPDSGRLRVKVLDFGLARLTESESTTQFGLALGTPSYMSPEQAAGRSDEIDVRTDIFALGATGFRLLALRRIHEDENVVRLVLKMANEPAPPLRSVAPKISEQVAAIIDRALAFNREDRYPTAAAMRADVRAARDTTDDDDAATVALALPGSAKTKAAEATIALSESDLEMPSAVPAPLPAPVPPPPPHSPEPISAVAEAPRRRSRRSMIPLVTLAFYGALFFAHRMTSSDDAAKAISPALPISPAPADLPANDAAAPTVDATVDAAVGLTVDATAAATETVDAALEGVDEASLATDAEVMPPERMQSAPIAAAEAGLPRAVPDADIVVPLLAPLPRPSVSAIPKPAPRPPPAPPIPSSAKKIPVPIHSAPHKPR